MCVSFSPGMAWNNRQVANNGIDPEWDQIDAKMMPFNNEFNKKSCHYTRSYKLNGNFRQITKEQTLCISYRPLQNT